MNPYTLLSDYLHESNIVENENVFKMDRSSPASDRGIKADASDVSGAFKDGNNVYEPVDELSVDAVADQSQQCGPHFRSSDTNRIISRRLENQKTLKIDICSAGGKLSMPGYMEVASHMVLRSLRGSCRDMMWVILGIDEWMECLLLAGHHRCSSRKFL